MSKLMQIVGLHFGSKKEPIIITQVGVDPLEAGCQLGIKMLVF